MVDIEVPQEPGNDRKAVGYCNPPVAYRFGPGNRANPGGRPKAQSLTSILREVMAERMIDGRTVGEKFIDQVLAHAAKRGDSGLIKEVFSRHDGPVPPLQEEKPAEAAADAYSDLLAKLYPDQPG